MIKAQELRICNWVNDMGSQPYQIQAEDLVYLSSSEKKGKINLDFNAIPLSPEILKEKAKFEISNDEYGGWLSPKETRVQPITEYRIRIMKDAFGFYYQNTMVTRIQYVHTFQNLIFALTGQELEITL